MNEQHDRWANRCLPLLVANEAGWLLLNPATFRATWDGSDHPRALRIDFADQDAPAPSIRSHFGYGIITWGVPYLFRTPPEFNLLVRGPANWPKDGVTPLEGLVETDWAVTTFTMNWLITRANHTIEFEAGEPFCMLVPQRRGELESFAPSYCALSSDPELADSVKNWAEGRSDANVRQFLSEYADDFAAERGSWQKEYFQGKTPEGQRMSVHQTHLKLDRFVDADSGPTSTSSE